MSVDLDDLSVLILDEADRLLELGFSAEIQELVSVCNPMMKKSLSCFICYFTIYLDMFFGIKCETHLIV
jgi:superfamily II DNA/RNA helicase